MKKVAIIFLVIVGLVIAAAFIFVSTLDINQYRPLIIQKVEEALGAPVELGSLSLKLKRTVVLGVQNFSSYSDSTKSKVALKFDEGSFSLNLLPLLQGQVQIGAVSLTKPHIELVRLADGAIHVRGVNFAKTANSSSSNSSSSSLESSKNAFSAVTIDSLEIKSGEVLFEDYSNPNKPLNLTINQLDTKIKSISITKPITFDIKAAFLSAKQNVALEGTVSPFAKDGKNALSFRFDSMPLGFFMPPNSENAPTLSGFLGGSLDAKASGNDWPTISKTLSGQGRITLKDGVILNFNILREVIEKISIIPGTDNAIRNQLPPNYQGKLNNPNTILSPIDIPFSIQNGVMESSAFNIASDSLAISGTASIGLDKSIRSKSTLALSQELSSVLIGLVSPLKLLANQAGQIQMPLEISGVLPHFKVVPDSSFISSKLLKSTAQEVMTNLIKDPSKGLDELKNMFGKKSKTES